MNSSMSDYPLINHDVEIGYFDTLAENLQFGMSDLRDQMLHAAETAPDPRSASMARILARNFQFSINATNALIDKLIGREMRLDRLHQQIESSQTIDDLKGVRDAVSALRVQDTAFDAEVDALRAILMKKLEQLQGLQIGENETTQEGFIHDTD